MELTHFYRSCGQGEPLLLLHGNGEDGSYFCHQLEYFSKYYRVIAPDTRGHGQTPRGSAPFTIRQFADDLAAFLSRLAIAQAHILGFSDGANIAMCFAIAYPQMVKKLILCGGNLDPSGIQRRVQMPIEVGYRIANRFAKKHDGARKHAEQLGLMVNDPNLSVRELARIQADTLVIAGTRDLVKRCHTEQIAAAIPKAELVFVPGDHFIAKKNPTAFNEAVRQFLRK